MCQHYAGENTSESTSLAEEKSPESDQLIEAGESEAGSDKKNNVGGGGSVGIAGPTGVTRTWNIAKTVWVG